MDAPHKLNIKLPNGSSFEAEGTEETVKMLFTEFLKIASATAVAAPLPVQAPLSPSAPVDSVRPASVDGLDATTMDRLFKIGKDGILSLRALPRGEDAESETLIALLYGISMLQGESNPSAIRLMRAARLSGVQKIRLNRTIGSQRKFITESGAGKGKRYGLNNPGMRRAEEILKSILG